MIYLKIKNLNIMDKGINELYNDYRDGNIDRRKFLKKLALYAGSTAAAAALLPALEGNSLQAFPVTDQDNGLYTEFIKYPGKSGDVIAFMARPAGDKKYPAVIVIHENRALQPHIIDVTRRMAAEGFLAIAPDALSPMGGTPDDEADAMSRMRDLDMETTTGDFVAAVKYLETHPLSTGSVGCTGFCWGGGMTNRVAVGSPELDAAVPYYGATPPPGDVPKIRAAIMAHYAGNDDRINAGIPAFEEAMKKAGIDYRIFIYEGASHAFNNDTNPSRYNEEAAKLAWKRTIGFFREKLA